MNCSWSRKQEHFSSGGSLPNSLAYSSCRLSSSYTFTCLVVSYVVPEEVNHTLVYRTEDGLQICSKENKKIYSNLSGTLPVIQCDL